MSTSLEITWNVIFIASLMPSVIGLGVYWYMGVHRKPAQPFFKSKQFATQKNQDWAYEQAAHEIENNSMDKAMWARVFAECDGDENKVKARYINKRVECLLLEKSISENESFVETDESKRSRLNIKHFFIGITVLVFVLYIASVIQDYMVSSKKTNATGYEGFDPDKYLKEKSWGATDQVISKPEEKSITTDKDGWEIIVPAPSSNTGREKPRLTFDQ